MLIDIKNATIGYDEKPLLSEIDFELDKGEFVFLTGVVGSGKSTFLKSLYAEAKIFSAQKAIVLGYNLLKIKKRHIPQLRRKIGFVFQDFKFLNDKNVYENLRFVLKATGWNIEIKIRRRIREVLKAVKMSDYETAKPYELSGGQQQKIAIARAILNNPPLILADEPTGNLDPDASEQITKILYNLSQQGTGVIMATHDQYVLNLLPNLPKYLVDNNKIQKIK